MNGNSLTELIEAEVVGLSVDSKDDQSIDSADECLCHLVDVIIIY